MKMPIATIGGATGLAVLTIGVAVGLAQARGTENASGSAGNPNYELFPF